MSLRRTLFAPLLAPVFAPLLAPLALATVLTSAPAQPVAGDVIVSSTIGGLFYFDRSADQFRTLASPQWNAVVVQDRNVGLIAALSDTVFHMSLAGVTTTVAVLPDGASVRAIATDQRVNTYAFATQNGILRLQGKTLSTVSVVNPNALCRDRNTGDFIAGGLGGQIWTVDPVTGTVNTVRNDLPGITGLAFLPSTGGFVVGRQSASDGVLLLDANFNTVKSFNLSSVQAVTVDERINRIWAVSTGASRALTRINPEGSVDGQTPLPTNSYTGVAVWESRTVSVDATGNPGSTASVHLRFPGGTNKGYCVALSGSASPGLALPGGQFLGLSPDNLFFLSACQGIPAVTTRFSGNLAFGRAIATFRIPAAALPGWVVHVSAVMIDPGAPGGLVVGNADSVEIR